MYNASIILSKKGKKMTKDNVSKQDYDDLFSKRRMDSYADEKEYNKNLELIEFLTPKLCLFEVFVRNKILKHPSINNKTSFIFTEIAKQKQINLKPLAFTEYSLPKLRDDIKKHFEEVQENENLFKRIDSVLDYCQKLVEEQELEIDKAISSQSMGFWASIINSNEEITFISDRDFLDKADPFLNITSPKKLSREETILRIKNTENKLDWVVLFLVKNLRNRAFHWENLLKVDDKGHSRISVSLEIPESQKKAIISIKTECIKDFINLCLDACDDRLKKIYGD